MKKGIKNCVSVTLVIVALLAMMSEPTEGECTHPVLYGTLYTLFGVVCIGIVELLNRKRRNG